MNGDLKSALPLMGLVKMTWNRLGLAPPPAYCALISFTFNAMLLCLSYFYSLSERFILSIKLGS